MKSLVTKSLAFLVDRDVTTSLALGMRILVLIFLLLLLKLPNAVALSFNNFITTGSDSDGFATADSSENLYLSVSNRYGGNSHVAVFDSNLTELRRINTVADASEGPITIYNDELYAAGGNFGWWPQPNTGPFARYNLNGDLLETYPGTGQSSWDLLVSSSGTIRGTYGTVHINDYFDTGNYSLSGFIQAERLALGENGNSLYISDVSAKKVFKYDASGNLIWQSSLNFNPWDIELVGDRIVASISNGRPYVNILEASTGSFLGQVYLGITATNFSATENYLYVSGSSGTAVYDIDDFATVVPYINVNIIDSAGLIAYFPFDGNANEELSNEFGDGPVNGQTADHVSFSSDRFGNPNSALRIEGERSNIDGYGVTGSGIDLRDSSVSISFWYQKQVDDYHDWVIGVGDDGNCWIVNIDYSAPDGIAWGVWNDDNVRYNLDPPLALEQWCHVVVTYDKNDTKKCIYVDGELVSEGYTDSSFTGTSNFKFGASGITLDDLRFYNRALSANEVSAIYDYDPGLIAYYPLLSGVSDVSGNDLHGNGVGVTFDDGYLNVGSGQYSNGDSYFSIPESVDQFRQNDFTISLWFRLSVTNHSNADGSMLFDIFGDRVESAIGNYISVRMHNDDNFYPINGMESLNGGLVIALREGGSSFNSSYAELGSIVGDLNNGHWHNLSITRRQNTISTYLNGLETSRITSEQITDINNTKPFKLGRSYSGWSSNPNINYKHLKIYDRELSSSEINKAYYEGLYNTKNYELVDLRSLGQADVTDAPGDYYLHTPSEMTTARTESRTLGQTDVTGNPAQYGLFTSSDISDAQSNSRSAGQQDVISSPSDYDLMGAEGVFDMRVSQPGISMSGDKASMNFTIQSSSDLQEWNNEETIQREYTMPSDKNFMRVSVGPELEPKTLTTIATDTYGDKLVQDDSNNLYVNDENTPLMRDGVNLRTDTYSGWNFYAIEPVGNRYLCILKNGNQNVIMFFELDGNYLYNTNVITDLSAYESDFGQRL
jgi:hypothetical protein